ncbi:uncharacterized protein (TIGR01370 family) [Roseiarcus fermentans]|uniref:Uncharacterized protein (TIGR01370 family) n=1 Tax=Roseiarcus fermentans TaxID=1473586 RepID=A0A366EZI2_9HYPH|nr:uncharacterized protein (TIGR01370 family) [Roseiarcus fermentans]
MIGTGRRPTASAPGLTRRDLLLAAGALIVATANGDASRASALPANARRIRWLAFYGATADEAVLGGYDLVVLDPGFTGDLGRIASRGARVCGYVSLGEIRTADPWFADLDDAALLPPNPAWPGTRRVDVRRPAWRALLLDRVIPALAARGFTGLMLDTLDTPPYLEAVDPAQYQGMRAAAVGLVAAVRAQCPDMTLVVNRGYALLPEVIRSVDAVIAESLLTSPDPKTGGFRWLDSGDVAIQLAALNKAARQRLPILSLDYWDPKDRSTIREIYRRERALGHHPYVATPLLNQIVPDEG